MVSLGDSHRPSGHGTVDPNTQRRKGLRTALGIVSLIVGVTFPMAMLIWLNVRMRRKSAFTANQTGLALALNGTLPVCLITLGFALLTGRLESSTTLQIVIAVCFAAAVVAAAGLWWAGAASRRRGDTHDRR
jgi:EamA domain-containing membrane protein RarD